MEARSIVEAVYQQRSALVHEGEIGTETKVKGIGRLPSHEVVERGIKLCAATICAIVLRGDIPGWSRFEFVQD